MPESEVQGQVSTTPPRNGFAAALIARNAADGARERADRDYLARTLERWHRTYGGPAMATNDPRTTRQIAVDVLHKQLANCLDVDFKDRRMVAVFAVDVLLRRFDLTTKRRPSEERLNEIVNSAYASMTEEKTAATLVELLRDDGFEIRAIEGGD